jgi:hypothetical protein
MVDSGQQEFPQHVVQAQRFVTTRYGRRASRLRLLGAGEWSRAYAATESGHPGGNSASFAAFVHPH